MRRKGSKRGLDRLCVCVCVCVCLCVTQINHHQDRAQEEKIKSDKVRSDQKIRRQRDGESEIIIMAN